MRAAPFIASLVILAAAPAAPGQESRPVVPEGKRTTLGLYVTAAQAYAMWKESPQGVKLIDTRTPEEYIFVGHPPMARNVPLLFIEHGWDARRKKPPMRANPDFVSLVRRHADPSDTVILMCRSGGRSARAVDELAKAGFTRAYTVTDGFEGDAVKDPASASFGKRMVNGWKNSGLPWTYALDPGLMYIAGAAARRGGVRLWGTLREALRDGRTQERVDAAEVARKGVWGVGALEGLRGEITIVDGDVWISTGRGEQPTTTRGAASAPATLLLTAAVDRWTEIAVDEAVAADELEGWLAARAADLGLGRTSPWPFVVAGPLIDLKVHVIAGECPMRARMLGKKVESPPYSARLDRIDATLVGFYAPDSAGVMVHAGARTHVHAVIAGGRKPITAHVESVGLAAGCVVKLPAGWEGR